MPWAIANYHSLSCHKMSFLTLFLGEEEARPQKELVTGGPGASQMAAGGTVGPACHIRPICVFAWVSPGRRHLGRPRIRDQLLGGLLVQSQLLQRPQRMGVHLCVSE